MSEPQPACDICFVVPAFDSMDLMPLGASTLIAACRARGFAVGAVYGSVLLASRIGYDLYETISKTLVRKQPGEYVFKPHAYAPEVLARIPADREHPKVRGLIAAAAPAVGPHLDEVAAAIAAKRPRIVGITNMFQQNMAAFAVARRVRALLPETLIVMGGANVTGVMAKGLAGLFDCVDYFFDGEADIVFPDFCEAFLRRGERPADRVVACAPIQNMDDVPAPDFSDFMAALREQQAAGRLPPELPLYVTYESSRGCWWGAKHHCTFCGLNQQGMNFRDKRPERVVAEVLALDAGWDRPLRTADNIMPQHFFEKVLPQLAAEPRQPRMHYEVKSNLKDEQVALMRQAGIYCIQPGIESFSTPVLKLMRKGVSAHQNIALLRMCAVHGLGVGWNLIYGFPGETAQNYRDMIALFPALAHLQPPDGFSEIMIDRFSPNFDDHARLGIPALKPFEIYRGLYPEDAPLDDIAFHFDGVYTTELLGDAALLDGLRTAVKGWQALWRSRGSKPVLRALTGAAGGIAVFDTRPVARARAVTLPRGAGEALAYLERPRSRAALPAFVAPHIEELLERRFVIDHEGLLMSVVVLPVQAAPHAAQENRPAHAAA